MTLYTDETSGPVVLHFVSGTIRQETVGVATPTISQMRGDAFVDDANGFNPLLSSCNRVQ